MHQRVPLAHDVGADDLLRALAAQRDRHPAPAGRRGAAHRVRVAVVGPGAAGELAGVQAPVGPRVVVVGVVDRPALELVEEREVGRAHARPGHGRDDGQRRRRQQAGHQQAGHEPPASAPGRRPLIHLGLLRGWAHLRARPFHAGHIDHVGHIPQPLLSRLTRGGRDQHPRRTGLHRCPGTSCGVRASRVASPIGGVSAQPTRPDGSLIVHRVTSPPSTASPAASGLSGEETPARAEGETDRGGAVTRGRRAALG